MSFAAAFKARAEGSNCTVTPPIAIGKTTTENGDVAHDLWDTPVPISGTMVALSKQITTHPNLEALQKALDMHVATIRAIGDEATRAEEVANLAVWVVQARALREDGAMGARDAAVVLYSAVEKLIPETAPELLEFILSVGSMADIVRMIEYDGTSDQSVAVLVRLFVKVIRGEQQRVEQGEPPQTLAGKWMPAEGRGHSGKAPGANSGAKRRKSGLSIIHARRREVNVPELLAKELFSVEEMTPGLWKQYRKLKTAITADSDVTRLMCRNEFGSIDMKAMPARALKTFRQAFLLEGSNAAARELPDRVKCRENLEQLFSEEHSKLAEKVDSIMPFEILSKTLAGKKDRSADPLFWAKVASVEGKLRRATDKHTKDQIIVPMIDVSGSMRVGTQTGKSAMDLAISLGLVNAAANPGVLRDHYLTFETDPHILSFGNRSDGISAIVNKVQRAPWGGSTDIDKAFALIAGILAKDQDNAASDVTLVIYSDMQFNAAVSAPSRLNGWGLRNGAQPACSEEFVKDEQSANLLQTAHDRARALFADLGLAGKIRIVYWNLTGNHVNQAPVVTDEDSMLLTGFSPDLLASVMDPDLLKRLEPEVDGANSTHSTTTPKMTPYNVIRAQLLNPAFFPVREILSASSELMLVDYHFTPPAPEEDRWVAVVE